MEANPRTHGYLTQYKCVVMGSKIETAEDNANYSCNEPPDFFPVLGFVLSADFNQQLSKEGTYKVPIKKIADIPFFRLVDIFNFHMQTKVNTSIRRSDRKLNPEATRLKAL